MEQRRYQQIGGGQWQKHIQVQSKSGQSISKYCQGAGLSESGFYLWRKRLQSKKSSLKRIPASTGFMRIDLSRQRRDEAAMPQAAGLDMSAAIVIMTPNGYRVQSPCVETAVSAARRLAQC